MERILTLLEQPPTGPLAWAIAAFGAAFFMVIVVRKRALTLDGALAAAVLGLVVLFIAGPLWLLPLFFFFGSSTTLGRLFSRAIAAHDDAKEGRPRDAVQVFCNGGPYGLLVLGLALNVTSIHFLMLLSMAIATADTWSSTVGAAVGGPTWNIRTGKRITPGPSGGVSIAGSLAGLGGAAAVAGLGLLFVPELRMGRALLLACAGWSGMFVDSLLGAWFQARYRTSSGTEGDTGTVLVGGFRWMTNDAVNLLSNVLVLVAWYLIQW